MNKKMIVTLTLAGLTLAACSNKDSYRAGKLEAQNTNGGVITDSMELKALEMLEKDIGFMSVHDNELSENIKHNILGVEVKELTQETENTTLRLTQFTILDQNSKDCSPIQFNTQAFTADQLRKGVKIKGQYRLQCIDEDCNDLLLFREKYAVAGPQSQEVLQASAVIRLSKDETGRYAPVASDDEVFAKVQNMDQAIEKCLTDKAMKSAHTTNAETRNASNRALDKDTQRLYQISHEIAQLRAQIKNSKNTLGRQALQSEIDALLLEKSQIQKRMEEKRQQEVKDREGKARKEYANSRSKSENFARLSQIDKDIRAIDTKIKALEGRWFSGSQRNTLNSERQKLMEERATVVQNIQNANAQVQMVDPMSDMKGPR